MSKVVIALGGNALGSTPDTQKQAVAIAAKTIVALAKKGHEIIICHGNGPQVGAINDVFTFSAKNKIINYSMPFAECGAMSQGYIGFHLQNAILKELANRNIKKNVATIITQTLVDKNDLAFKNPTKPIGPFLTKEESILLNKQNFNTVEDSGRGYRRVVPSPTPIDIIEKQTIKNLILNKTITIAGGGGGVPVYLQNNTLFGVDAVIDKDLTSAKLAELINADFFIILTAVNKIKINFNTPEEKSLDTVSVKDLKKLILQKQFAPGSMLPKVKALISFVESTSKKAYIGLLSEAAQIIDGTSGTIITL